MSSADLARAPSLGEPKWKQCQVLCQKPFDHRPRAADIEVIAALQSIYRLSEVEGSHGRATIQQLLHFASGRLSSKKRDER